MRLVSIGVAGQDPELVADRCWQAGAAGLWEVDAHTLRAGVEDELAAAFFAGLADLGPVDVTEAESVELAGRRSIVSMAGRDLQLWVPATVFGDGNHPTTACCLELLPTIVEHGDRVLDVGCGAGALAVGSALLGGVVTAIDIDTEAVEATRANATCNGVAVEASTTPLAVLGPHDVVLANLTAGALRPLVADLVRCTAAGGKLMVSGMLESQWPAIRDAVGGTVEQVRVEEGWVTSVVTVD